MEKTEARRSRMEDDDLWYGTNREEQPPESWVSRWLIPGILLAVSALAMTVVLA